MYNFIMKFEEDRKTEIKYLTQKIDNNENMLINGAIGVGKSTLIKKAVKNSKRWFLKEIDAAKISKNEIEKGSFYKHGGFWGSINIIYSNIWARSHTHIFPLIALCYTILGFMHSIKSVDNILLWLMPLIIGIGLVLIIWFLKKVVYNLFVSKKYVVNISELNFVADDKKARTIIWLINDIYGKNVLYTFESTENINIHIQSRFGLSKMHMQNNLANKDLLEEKLNDLVRHTNDSVVTSGYAKMINYLQKQYRNSIHQINGLALMFSYRELKTILDDFVSYFKSVKGEIEIFDFMCFKYLEIQNLELLKFIQINWKAIVDFNDKQQSIGWNNKRKELEDLTNNIEKKCKTSGEKFVIDHFMPAGPGVKEIFATKLPKYSFFKAEYKSIYEGSVNFAFLQSHLITNFLKGPKRFLEYVNTNKINIRLVNFDLIDDNEAISFLEKFNSNDLDLDTFIKRQSFLLDRSPSDLVSYLIFESRKNPKKFIAKLNKKNKLVIIDQIDEISDENEFEKLSSIKNMSIDDVTFNTLMVRPKFKRKYSEQKYIICSWEEYIKKAIELKRHNLIRNIFYDYKGTWNVNMAPSNIRLNSNIEFFFIFEQIKSKLLIDKIVKIIRDKDKRAWIIKEEGGKKIIINKGEGPNPIESNLLKTS